MSPTDSTVPGGEADALLRQAFDAHRRADFAEAGRLYRAAIAVNPREPRALANLGALGLQQGRAEEALGWLDQALALNPEHKESLGNRAGALRALGRRLEALESVDKALALDPRQADALNTRGLLLVELGRPVEAVAPLEAAIANAPAQPICWNNHGMALAALSRPQEALRSFERALTLAPGYAEALSNRAAALRALGRLDEALTICDQLLALDPGHIDACINRACILNDLGQTQTSLAALEQVCAAVPDHVEAHWSLASALLAAGRWAEGWPLFEWRWRLPDFQPFVGRFDQPLWLGETSLAGKTLLLQFEQGFGDTIQMLRYAEMAAADGARVILAVQKSLLPLVRDLPGVTLAVGEGEPLPPFDLYTLLMSLPLAFATRPETVPWREPYLSPPPDAESRWQARLALLPRPRIGLAWSGNPRHLNDRNRSLSLEALAPLLETGASIVSLQKDYRPGDRDRLAALAVIDLSADLHDFADTAGAISQLDMVIAVDTSVAHLAGAMGKPLLLLLPFAADCRWLNAGDRTPWYPSARLLRQDRPNDWSLPLHQAAEAIAALGDQPG